MSKVRPYLVTVGAQEYMIRATNQGQAINVAVKAHPMPVANAVAASADEVASWALAGKPIQTKDDFAPILPPTLVMQVMPDGKLASFCDGFRLEPGNYFLTLELFAPEAGAEVPPDALDEIQATDEEVQQQLAESGLEAEADANEAEVDASSDVEEDFAPLDPPAMKDLAPPRFNGAFEGDTYCADMDDRSAKTHVWRDKAWHRIPLS